MSTGFQHQDPNHYHDNLQKVLILGGWSPGPLHYLRHRFRNRCIFIEPEIPMPFWSGLCSCCCNVYIFLIVGGIVVASYVIRFLVISNSNGFLLFLWILLIIGALFVYVRFCIAILVRSSIRIGSQIAQNEIHQCSIIPNHNNNNNNNNNELQQHHGTNNDGIRVIIGFSWGGGILANLYWNYQQRQYNVLSNGQEQHLQDDTEQQQQQRQFPSMMFLAPTTTPMSKIALQKDPPLFMRLSSDHRKENVHVFHATNDGFCPYPERWERTGATTHMCRDTHIFQTRSSQQLIGDVLESLLSSSSTHRNNNAL